ncbi:hypothetical protein GQ55_4G125000 [Panicum hallii var. hallii]|jgi:hypothetical protein|uniref:Uncharacterized protein n=2 Tax=Panicum hallii TaxID=206008 RepID=A0A2T7DXX0_9POAL|nr:uncharacterized protein LOC112890964 [Panicum hallii]PUZ60426.1 hypothetical protein GQ55_4G125000 [Panicum hallii var. hallii]PVH47708.1 hypothetical protein PAHAL_4G124700 [Panicum hallii]
MAAAGSGADKENAAPSTSAATAAGPRRHGYGVRSCGVKKRSSRARGAGRVPLRDITNLVAAAAGPEATLAPGQDASPAAVELAKKPDAAVPAVAGAAEAQDGAAAGGAAAKKAAAAPRYSLRKGFR